jgi:hypothetical protein
MNLEIYNTIAWRTKIFSKPGWGGQHNENQNERFKKKKKNCQAGCQSIRAWEILSNWFWQSVRGKEGQISRNFQRVEFPATVWHHAANQQK